MGLSPVIDTWTAGEKRAGEIRPLSLSAGKSALTVPTTREAATVEAATHSMGAETSEMGDTHTVCETATSEMGDMGDTNAATAGDGAVGDWQVAGEALVLPMLDPGHVGQALHFTIAAKVLHCGKLTLKIYDLQAACLGHQQSMWPKLPMPWPKP
jgi:hypothetical protein